MKGIHFQLFVISVCFLVSIGLLVVMPAHATPSGFVRLDTQSAYTETGAMVCLTPESFGQEASVDVTLPSQFTLQNSTQFITDTSDIPADAIPWPGITNATSISGHTVTFQTDDLQTGTTYCFHFVGIKTTGGVATEVPIRITTKNQSYTVLDTLSVGTAITANGQTTVSATVAPHTIDYQFALTSKDDRDTFRQDETPSYDIEYGAKQSAALPATTTITASWENVILGGTELLRYEPHSATGGYNGATPVIDTLHRTITWSIPNLPPGVLNQHVSFQLKTSDNYTVMTRIPFTVTAKMGNQYATMPDNSLQQYYLFNYNPPSSSSLPHQTPTLTPQPSVFVVQPLANQITDIQIPEVKSTQATITVTTKQPSTIKILYGTKPTALLSEVSVDTHETENDITLTHLLPHTTYYFKAVAQTSGTSVTSDLYTFTTAVKETAPFSTAIIVTHQNSVLFNGTLEHAFVLLPEKASYGLSLQNPNYQSVVLSLTDTNGHDISISSLTDNPVASEMRKITSDTFQTQLSAPPETGSFILHATITTKDQEVQTIPVLLLRVSTPFTVREKNSDTPIEHAKVVIYTIPDNNMAQSAVYTATDGTLDLVLPGGVYKAVVSNLLYETQSVGFRIDNTDSAGYPTISLTKAGTNIFTLTSNFTGSVWDFLVTILDYLMALGTSSRFLAVVETITVSSLVFLSYLFFLKKAKLHAKDLFPFVLSSMSLKNGTGNFAKGVLLDENKMPVKQATVFLLDEQERLISKTSTTSKGVFILRNTIQSSSYSLFAIKEGCKPSETITVNQKELFQKRLTLSLIRSAPEHAFRHRAALITENLGGMLFEVILVLSLILEGGFAYHFGVQKTAPFILLSLGNIYLWLVYELQVKHPHR